MMMMVVVVIIDWQLQYMRVANLCALAIDLSGLCWTTALA